MKKVLLVRSPSEGPFGPRAEVILAYLKGVSGDGIEITELDPGPPTNLVVDEVVAEAKRLRPSIAIFCSSGYERAALGVQEEARRWDSQPLLAVVSKDEDDLAKIKAAGMIAIVADAENAPLDGYAHLSDKEAVLTALGLGT